jgi:hypothetical protein
MHPDMESMLPRAIPPAGLSFGLPSSLKIIHTIFIPYQEERR